MAISTFVKPRTKIIIEMKQKNTWHYDNGVCFVCKLIQEFCRCRFVSSPMLGVILLSFFLVVASHTLLKSEHVSTAVCFFVLDIVTRMFI